MGERLRSPKRKILKEDLNMKFRKTISALAALAMSVSCLAGLTITANAATATVDLTAVADTYIDPTSDDTKAADYSAATALKTGAYTGGYWWNSGQANQGMKAYNGLASSSQLAMIKFKLPDTAIGEVTAASLKLYVKNSKTNAVRTLWVFYPIVGSGLLTENEGVVSGNWTDTTTTFNSTGIWSRSNWANLKYRPFPVVLDEDGNINTNASISTNDYSNLKVSLPASTDGQVTIADLDSNGIVSYLNSNYCDPDGYVTFIFAAQGDTTIYSSENTDKEPVLSITYSNDPKANYTTKYVDEAGTEIKTAKVTKKALVGSDVVVTDDDKKDIFTGEGDSQKKYIYKSDDSETNSVKKTVAADGSTVITMTFREAPKINYTVKENVNNTVLKSGSNFEGEKVSYDYSHYIIKNNKLYSKAAIDNQFADSFVLGSTNNQVETVEYTAVDDTKTYTYFAEAEDLLEGNPDLQRATGRPTRSSMGAGAKFTKTDDKDNIGTQSAKVAHLTSGKYKMTAGFHLAKTGDGRSATNVFSVAGKSVFEHTITNLDNHDITSADEFEVKGEADVIYTVKDLTTNDAHPELDYVLFERTGDAEHDVTIDAAEPTIAATDATTGTVGAPTFESIKANYNFEDTKIFRVTVAAPTDADKATVPVVTIGDTVYNFTAADWTTVADADGYHYYMQFVKRDKDKWETFGNVSVSFGTGENAATKTLDLTE